MGDALLTSARRSTKSTSVNSTGGEGGNAMIIVLMMISMLAVLTLTLATLSVNNLTGARRAQQAGVALNAAEAGLAQAAAYLRENGVQGLSSSRWGSETTPVKVAIPGTNGASFTVWIKTIEPPTSSNPTGVYRINAVGRSGTQAVRTVSEDVTVALDKFPLGVFGSSISSNGSVEVQKVSMFTTGCVTKRSQLHFYPTNANPAVDILNGIPAGVHSSGIIVEDENKCITPISPIHTPTTPCNPLYPADQDPRGGSVVGTVCEPFANQKTSLIANSTELFARYNLKPPPSLTDAQVDQLKAIAIAQNTYTKTIDASTILPRLDLITGLPVEKNAVMFFDLLTKSGTRTVDLRAIPGFERAGSAELGAEDSGCWKRSLVIVVNGGDVTMTSNTNLAASLFVLGDSDHGNFSKGAGTVVFTGTLYANHIDLHGNISFHMDECFKANMSPSLFDLQTSNYRELDR